MTEDPQLELDPFHLPFSPYLTLLSETERFPGSDDRQFWALAAGVNKPEATAGEVS